MDKKQKIAEVYELMAKYGLSLQDLSLKTPQIFDIVEILGKKCMYLVKDYYLLLETPDINMNWNDASDWCASKGGFLPDTKLQRFIFRKEEKINLAAGMQIIGFGLYWSSDNDEKLATVLRHFDGFVGDNYSKQDNKLAFLCIIKAA